MKNLLSVCGCICLMAIAAGCYWDNPPKPIPIDPELVSFETHIMPIFNTSCNSSTCHDADVPPDLTPENAWRELHAGGYVNTTVPEESILYREIEFGSMPPVGSLTSTEKELILAWIKKGAFND